jgi:hypothetical protein
MATRKTAKKAAKKAAKKPAKKTVAKAAKPKAKAKAPATAKGPTKLAQLQAMLAGEGSTNTDLCKALGWQPHTLRAAISRLGNVARERVDGVTTYRVNP